MVTTLIIFAAVVVAGLAFWFYNRRKIQTLSEQVTDKDAVINAFRTYSENANNEWSGTTLFTLEDSIDEQTPTTQPEKQKQKSRNKKRTNGNANGKPQYQPNKNQQKKKKTGN